MGSSISKKERSERPSKSGEYAALASKTPFSLSEVEALNELFTKLSSSIVQDKHISKEELQLALFQHCNKQNLFLDRIFDLFDAKRNGHIDFGEFVEALSIFHPKTPDDVKIKYAFKLYDLRQTGYIEIEELKAMVVALLNESDLMLSDDVVQMIVDKTFKEADTKGDGRIDVEEWKEYAEKNPSLLKNMTLPYLMCVPTPLIVNNTHPSRSLLNKSCQFMGANSQETYHYHFLVSC